MQHCLNNFEWRELRDWPGKCDKIMISFLYGAYRLRGRAPACVVPQFSLNKVRATCGEWLARSIISAPLCAPYLRFFRRFVCVGMHFTTRIHLLAPPTSSYTGCKLKQAYRRLTSNISKILYWFKTNILLISNILKYTLWRLVVGHSKQIRYLKPARL